MKFKKALCILLGSAMLIGMTACGDTNDDSSRNETNFDLPTANASAFVNVGDNPALVSGSYRMEFVKGEEGYGLQLVDVSSLQATATATTETIMFDNEAPAKVKVRGGATTLLGTFAEKSYTAPYSAVSKKDYGYLATSTVKTDNGSEIIVEDAYHIEVGGIFAVERKVEVLSANIADKGFESVYSLKDPSDAETATGFDFFIPAILYKDTKNMVSGAIASGLNVDRVYVKETRTGLPLAMLRKQSNKYSVAIAHLDPQIDVGGEIGGGFKGDINNKLQYGSIGYSIKDGVAVDFCYPSAEGPTTYDAGSGWSQMYHKVEVGTSHTYKLSITPTTEQTYAKAMTKSFKAAYTAEEPYIDTTVNIDDIYDYNIEIFEDTYKEFGTGKVIAAGLPWSIKLEDGSIVEYTFQMGFVGQQIPAAYHLMSTGYANNDASLVQKGTAMVDFWTSQTIMSDALPTVWWDPRDTETAGQSRGYPSFLRCFIDGMEGALDAYRVAKANGVEKTQWKNAVVKVGEFLVNNQNSDGSFYRAYNTNGTVCTSNADSRYQGTSKLNTPIAVRFLAKMYEFTGEEKYKAAALKAADYAYNELYLGLEKYVGGTPDNANTVDKEAAIYAAYCFNAAYMLTGEEKYLEAADHAAASAMSWVYCYDFACPSSSALADTNPFMEKGRVSGFSLIATGHSGADNFAAYLYYEMFKMYIETGEDFYLNAAKLLQNNSKLSTDYNGKMGWKYRALGPEASRVCDFSFTGVGVWLPWSGVANVEPIQNMRLAFGNADIMELTTDRDQLNAALQAYGVGGKPLTAN